jgi:hypothetical protein
MADPLRYVSIKARNLKCFGEHPEGFDAILPMNIIIGKNNTGKTTLLDLIDLLKQSNRMEKEPGWGHLGREPVAVITLCMEGACLEQLNRALGFDGSEAAEFTRAFGGHSISYLCRGPGKPVDPEISFGVNPPYDQPSRLDSAKRVRNSIDSCIRELLFVRLSADRDIRPEIDQTPASGICESDFKADGTGATKVLQRMLNNNNAGNRAIIKTSVLADLNKVCAVDGTYRDLHVFRKEGHQPEEWEIHLELPDGMLVPMSRMGSGLRTILLLLICLHVVPRAVHGRHDLSCFLFGFEELENNLHPAIQRRLFRFLRAFAAREHCRFFITTQSHVVIDIFSQDASAQIVHVYREREGDPPKAQTASRFLHHCRVFDDMGVSASDLLQSNCIIWVEGPSDKIYAKKWIELFANDLEEHVDFEFAFTSGTLLTHLTFDPDAGGGADVEKMIQALKLNRNAIILMDRDWMEGETKPRVERVQREIEDNGGFAWVTKGKEVENYIPVEVLRGLCGSDDLVPPDDSTGILDFIAENGGGKLHGEKVKLASRVCGMLTREMLERVSDLKERIQQVTSLIRRWNARDETMSDTEAAATRKAD